MKTIKDMTNQKLFYFSIFFTICEIYGTIVTFRKVLNELAINDFVFIRLVGFILVFCLFFFARPNRYWKIGYILFLSAVILHTTAMLSNNILPTIIIPLLLISLFLSIFAIFCFLKFKKMTEEIKNNGAE